MTENTVQFVDGPYAVGAVDLMVDPRNCPEQTPKGLFARVFYPVDKNYADRVGGVVHMGRHVAAGAPSMAAPS